MSDVILGLSCSQIESIRPGRLLRCPTSSHRITGFRPCPFFWSGAGGTQYQGLRFSYGTQLRSPVGLADIKCLLEFPFTKHFASHAAPLTKDATKVQSSVREGTLDSDLDVFEYQAESKQKQTSSACIASNHVYKYANSASKSRSRIVIVSNISRFAYFHLYAHCNGQSRKAPAPVSDILHAGKADRRQCDTLGSVGHPRDLSVFLSYPHRQYRMRSVARQCEGHASAFHRKDGRQRPFYTAHVV